MVEYIDGARLRAAVDVAKDLLGDALISFTVLDTSAGLALVEHNSQPQTAAFFSRLRESVRRLLDESSLPPLSRYMLLNLEEEQLIVIQQNVGTVITQIVVRKAATNTGIVMSLARPKIAMAVDAAFTPPDD